MGISYHLHVFSSNIVIHINTPKTVDIYWFDLFYGAFSTKPLKSISIFQLYTAIYRMNSFIYFSSNIFDLDDEKHSAGTATQPAWVQHSHSHETLISYVITFRHRLYENSSEIKSLIIAAGGTARLRYHSNKSNTAETAEKVIGNSSQQQLTDGDEAQILWEYLLE